MEDRRACARGGYATCRRASTGRTRVGAASWASTLPAAYQEVDVWVNVAETYLVYVTVDGAVDAGRVEVEAMDAALAVPEEEPGDLKDHAQEADLLGVELDDLRVDWSVGHHDVWVLKCVCACLDP